MERPKTRNRNHMHIERTQGMREMPSTLLLSSVTTLTMASAPRTICSFDQSNDSSHVVQILVALAIKASFNINADCCRASQFRLAQRSACETDASHYETTSWTVTLSLNSFENSISNVANVIYWTLSANSGALELYRFRRFRRI